MSYADLLERRKASIQPEGHDIEDTDIHESLMPFQRWIVKWAVRTGRCAVWADTGLGKTRMQLEWCRLSALTTLIVAPLAVCDQTVEEAAKIGIDARYVRHASELNGPGLYVTNFEMVANFPGAMFGAIALDEASILKASDGKTRTLLINHFKDVPLRSAWTATPGPNDPEELTNQAEFTGHMTRTNMLAAYFIHDEDGWRRKNHAKRPMAEWMNSWALAIKKPSDLGFEDFGYELPGLNIFSEIVDTEIEPGEGELFARGLGGVTGRAQVRKQTIADRIQRAVDLVRAEPDEPWMFWCGMNAEAEMLARELPGSVNIHGSLSPEVKAAGLRGFAKGEYQILISKPSIAAFGLNFQHCARTAFVGLSDSYESYYQCIRRFYRFGQHRVVNAHVILSNLEREIAQNVMRKEHQANEVIDLMIDIAKDRRES